MQPAARGNSIQAMAVVAVVCLVVAGATAQGGMTDRSVRQLDPIATSGGKPVVLIFVRTDCPISKRYAPTVQKLAAKYAGQATFWLVFPSKEDSFEIIAGHKRQFGYKQAVLRDPNHVLVTRAKAT